MTCQPLSSVNGTVQILRAESERLFLKAEEADHLDPAEAASLREKARKLLRTVESILFTQRYGW